MRGCPRIHAPAALLPDSLRHRANACPFECCVYRDWTPTGDVSLRPRPSHAEPTRTDDVAPYALGDTLVVLDYVGEGFFNVWDGERVREVAGFWGAEVFPSHGELLGGDRYAREWWVHATTRAGEKGWFNADSVARLRGADACGGPDPI